MLQITRSTYYKQLSANASIFEVPPRFIVEPDKYGGNDACGTSDRWLDTSTLSRSLPNVGFEILGPLDYENMHLKRVFSTLTASSSCNVVILDAVNIYA